LKLDVEAPPSSAACILKLPVTTIKYFLKVASQDQHGEKCTTTTKLVIRCVTWYIHSLSTDKQPISLSTTLRTQRGRGSLVQLQSVEFQRCESYLLNST